jgi:hypothetical protein
MAEIGEVERDEEETGIKRVYLEQFGVFETLRLSS